jgi:hypothetical protein
MGGRRHGQVEERVPGRPAVAQDREEQQRPHEQVVAGRVGGQGGPGAGLDGGLPVGLGDLVAEQMPGQQDQEHGRGHRRPRSSLGAAGRCGTPTSRSAQGAGLAGQAEREAGEGVVDQRERHDRGRHERIGAGARWTWLPQVDQLTLCGRRAGCWAAAGHRASCHQPWAALDRRRRRDGRLPYPSRAWAACCRRSVMRC